MGLFSQKGGETLFRNEDALDLEFVPKLLPYRELQQKRAAACIRPLLEGRPGRNALVHGPPGVGKTAAIKWVLRELEDTTDDVEMVYINCWQKNTTFKIFEEICQQLGYKFTQNKRTEELFEVIKNIVNKKAGVFVFDEVDKVEDHDFLYSILEELYKKAVFLVTNYKEWLEDIDERIRSRMTPEIIEFRSYSKEEVSGILKHRAELALIPGALTDDALNAMTSYAFEAKDIRVGMFLFREAALASEYANSKRILFEHANVAITKAKEFVIRKPDDLGDDTKQILDVVKKNSGSKIGDLFRLYKEVGGFGTYKTFQRKIDRLERGGFVTANKIIGGAEGTTTIVDIATKEKPTTLDRF
ncbi:AAA family ATPase [Candidatus Woesearchaeota archaeon]|nr:AAA family ATPase [Candidatus Woesearchaeota archaeon]